MAVFAPVAVLVCVCVHVHVGVFVRAVVHCPSCPGRRGIFSVCSHSYLVHLIFSDTDDGDTNFL